MNTTTDTAKRAAKDQWAKDRKRAKRKAAKQAKRQRKRAATPKRLLMFSSPDGAHHTSEEYEAWVERMKKRGEWSAFIKERLKRFAKISKDAHHDK